MYGQEGTMYEARRDDVLGQKGRCVGPEGTMYKARRDDVGARRDDV